MSDEQGQPSEEEIEAYYAQLREAPLQDLLIQAVQMLASGAEAKLGRPDARVLIDSTAALVQIGGAHMGEAEEPLKSAVGQLQMAQVQIEKKLAAEAGETPEGEQATAPPAQPGAPSQARQPTPTPRGQGQPGQGQPAQGQGQPTQGQPTQGQPTQGQGQPGQKATDKLWIPGR